MNIAIINVKQFVSLINITIAHNIKQTYIAFLYQILFKSNENDCDKIMRYNITQLNDFDVFK